MASLSPAPLQEGGREKNKKNFERSETEMAFKYYFDYIQLVL
uniref:Uncharacterized protein n=1 Tax=Anguilla anguilla TaxID=7936 RepID=A0A0E9S2L6_ANGAN